MDADVWREAKGVLAEALLCPPNERDAWVVERCSDPFLRREVQAYLRDYDEEFLETVLTVSNTFDLATPSDAEELPDVHPGDRIGPYLIVGRVGAGGMGHVFLATDTRLQRKVALKCLKASGSSSDLHSKIIREAIVAALANHPNIAIVYDVVEHEGRTFLVMEYVEGENLADLLRHERLSIEAILSMGRQLASALGAAHAKGIIHRDLKPANIQVMPNRSVKILDFGVAHAMSIVATETTEGTTTDGLQLPAQATLRTERGRMMHPGTPAYMSPEQMFGKEIDQRSDIYSLGVVMYEMATGHRPYSAEDPLDVVLALSRKLLRPTGAEANLSPEIHAVLAKMLAVNVEERYQTAAELETALVALTAPDPTFALSVPPVTAWARTWPVVRYAAVGLLAVVVVVSLGLLETVAFNSTLGRIAPFSEESALEWAKFGLQSMFLPTLYLVLISIAMWAARFGVRVLSLSHGIERLLTTGISQTARLKSRLDLDDPLVLAQAVAGVGFVLLAIDIWYFYPFMSAWGARSISTQPAEQFLPLQTGHRTAGQVDRFLLTVLIYGLSVAVIHIQRLRARQRVRRGASALGLVITLLGLVVALCQVPYRIMSQNLRPRIDVAGERCFLLGEHDDDLLVHCPNRPAPRNRIVKKTAGVHTLGVTQSIFDPPETSD